MIFRSFLALSLTVTPALSADICVSTAEIEALNGTLASYSDVLSDISCDAPALAAHQILCDSETLWPLAVADAQAWVYAFENATGTEANRDDPPRDQDFIAMRDACTDETCLCDALKGHIGDALGGRSPLK